MHLLNTFFGRKAAKAAGVLKQLDDLKHDIKRRNDSLDHGPAGHAHGEQGLRLGDWIAIDREIQVVAKRAA